MFDWKEASVEEIARYMLTLSRSNVSTQVAYYKLKNNTQMLTKIEEARKLAKVYRLRAKAQALEEAYYNNSEVKNDTTDDSENDA